ncbi:MAG: ornithine carbamoyltransferase [Acidobacteria bacterium RIFCSPLOWO2_12_FULL_54_10]|nr:MAG: ornithine carbamoyltransferase [Acidobacteria bacterium RIFCSPLOWO2_12_FULL_54_10]
MKPKKSPSLGLAGRNLVLDTDLSPAEASSLLAVAARIRKQPARYRSALSGRFLALLFEKPSLRTRVTFEVAMKSLGGDSLFLDFRGESIGQREPVADVARNLGRWVHAIAARTFRHSTVEQLAASASIPVINALSDRVHPCQALADMLTLQDVFGRLKGLHLAYVGDGNNVAHSLLLAGSQLGVHVSVATPPSYEPDPEIVSKAQAIGARSGSKIRVLNDPKIAVAGAHAVYTDVWTSMGSEKESEVRRRKFAAFRVTRKLFAEARKDAIFLHCLPAHRGEEVEAEVLESDRSRVLDQAENRLHAQKALLWLLLSGRTPATRSAR